MPFERARDLMPVALRRRCLQTAQACLMALVQGGHPVAIDVLARLLDREDGELAAAAGQLSLAVDSAGQLSLAEAEKPQRPERTSG